MYYILEALGTHIHENRYGAGNPVNVIIVITNITLEPTVQQDHQCTLDFSTVFSTWTATGTSAAAIDSAFSSS